MVEVTLRSRRRALDVLLPLTAAIAVTCAAFTLGGRQLNMFHLIGLLLVVGVYQWATGSIRQVADVADVVEPTQALTFFLLLKAFASGSTAATGVEAIVVGQASCSASTAFCTAASSRSRALYCASVGCTACSKICPKKCYTHAPATA